MACDGDALRRYMQSIERHPLLTLEEETGLAGRALAGDLAARERLVLCNLRLVVKIAHDYKGCGLPFADLVAEGNIGLMRAVETFDPAKGAKLSSYSSWWIKQAMRRALANQARTIRVPAQAAAKIGRIKATRAQLSERLEREPTNGEIARESGLALVTVGHLGQGQPDVYSLHEPILHGEPGERLELVADAEVAGPDEVVRERETLRHMHSLLGRLSERERVVIAARFGLGDGRPQTLRALSRTMRLTCERVRQIQVAALAKMRALMKEECCI